MAGILTIGLPLNPTSAQEKHKYSFVSPPGVSTYTQQHEIEVGDVPGHKVRIYEVRAKSSRAGRGQCPTSPTAADGRGAMASGDKIFSRFETLVQTVVKGDGSRMSSYTTVTTLTGGTGKFTTIRGTLRGGGATDFKIGLSGVKTEGEYWLEK
jgi:hypothetical protein